MESTGLLQTLRDAKHQALVGQRHARQALRPIHDRLLDVYSRAWSRLIPYRFRADRYEGFLGVGNLTAARTEPVARRLFVCWTGDNAMSPNRRKGYDSLRRLNPDLDVVLITPATLPDWIHPDHPIHPSYQHLSLIHRSDYLRNYLLNFHGGGYADVKTYQHPMAPSFDAFDDSNLWLVGYPEIGRVGVPNLPGRLGVDLKRYFPLLVGNGAFVARPGTPLTAEWHRELHRRLDAHQAALERAPGGLRGERQGYPVEWSELQANIFHPLILKYHAHVRHDDRIRPDFHDYL